MIFPLMTSGANPIDLISDLIEKRCRGLRQTRQCFFFEMFLAIIFLEIIAIVCEKKSLFSQNLTFGDPQGWQGCQKLFFTTDFNSINQLVETPSVKNWQKTCKLAKTGKNSSDQNCWFSGKQSLEMCKCVPRCYSDLLCILPRWFSGW